MKQPERTYQPGDRVTVDAGVWSYYRQLDRVPGTVTHVWDDGSVTVAADEPPITTAGPVVTVPRSIVEPLK